MAQSVGPGREFFKMFRVQFIVFLIAATLALPSLAVHIFESVLEDSSLEFVSHTPAFDVTGHFKKWKVTATLEKLDPTVAKIHAEVDTRTLDTGIARRDKHLRGKDFFWASNYPTATFVSKRITKASAKNTYMVEGVLRVRDREKRVRVPMTFSEEKKNAKPAYRFRGTVTVNRHDFGIVYQTEWFFIPTIIDEVDIKINALLVARP
jgi:polyisoprenoid-binding protein YceI